MNRLDHIAVLSTGGTFNKIYNPVAGELEVDPEAKALRQIAERWLCRFPLHTLIGKDSLEMDDNDREELARTIETLPERKILVIHGTDTIDRSAAYLAERFGTERQIVLTGAMFPYAIDPVEATANFAAAIGWLRGSDAHGVHIALHGLFLPHREIVKDREAGIFKSRA